MIWTQPSGPLCLWQCFNISTCPRSCFFSITTWGLVSNQNFLSDHPSFPKNPSQRKNCRHLSKTIEHSPLRQPLPRLSVGKLNHIEDKTNNFFIKIHDIIVKATQHQKPSQPTWEAQKQLPWQMWNISGSGDLRLFTDSLHHCQTSSDVRKW